MKRAQTKIDVRLLFLLSLLLLLRATLLLLLLLLCLHCQKVREEYE